jgi:archaemetzincin
MKRCKVFALILPLIITACKPSLPPGKRVFALQPFAGISSSEVKTLYGQLKAINSNAIVKPAIPLPASAFYAPRNRYRADSLINYLARSGSADTVIIGLTDKDISTTKGTMKDWGVMGLGFQRGNACIVSTFRLSRAELSAQLYKISLHELAHTQGLPHCKNKTCLMRDAEGGNHLDEEIGFCDSCKAFLKSKGWVLK